MPKVLLSVDEVAEATGMERKSVRAAVERGEIPGKRFGRLIKIPVWWVEEQRHGPDKARAADAA
jgi:excisionase family DNA binding protein